MTQKFISVPFKASNNDGLSEHTGIAKFSSAGIIVEYESKFLGMIGGEVKEVRISLDEILDIKFKKGFYKFFSKIEFRLKNYTTLSRLPNESGKVKLKIKREDFELAQAAVVQTHKFMGIVDPTMLEATNDEANQLQPPQTSVNELFDTKKLNENDPKETNKLD